MSAASTLICTAGTPAVPSPTPSPATRRHGNPNLPLAPRCGARTRAGSPCRAPSIAGKQRCRMHGGRSTGPRTPEGLARLRAARTSSAADARFRATICSNMSFARRTRVLCAAMRYLDRLPEDLAARLRRMPPELAIPPTPTRGITVAEDRALRRADAAALAPWRQAVAQARQAGRPGHAAPAAPGQSAQAALATAAAEPCDLPARPLAPEQTAVGSAAPGEARRTAHADPAAKPHAPVCPAAARPAAPAAPREAETKPLAPERRAGPALAGATASPGGPASPATRAHAPERRAAATAAPNANPETRLHAPGTPRPPVSPVAERDGHETQPTANRHTRRWHRKWQRMQQKRAASSRA